MKPSSCRRLLCLFVTTVALLAGRRAVADIGFSASATNAVAVSNTLTYTFNLTNVTGLDIPNVFLTNQFSIALATNQSGWITVNSNTIVLPIGTLLNGTVLITNWSGNPTAVGVRTNDLFLTNVVTLVASGQTNVTTNLVTQIVIPRGNLSVSIAVPTQNILAGDVMVVDVTVTNPGPDTVSNVLLTNQIFPFATGFTLLTPTNLISLFSNGNLTVNVGNLPIGGSTNLHLTFQPSVPETNLFRTDVVAASLVDTNLANNTAFATNIVGGFLTSTNDLTITVVTQRFNFLTGLLEVTLRLTNNTATPVPATRLIASGLPAGARLYNGSGTNFGNGYALYNATLAAGASVDLVLEFYVLKVSSFTNYTVAAVGVPVINLNTSTTNGTPVLGTSYNSAGFLIKFAATIGKTYTVLYSDNASFTNAQTAQPSIIAPATQVQWIDYGPPKTASHPTNTAQRFYRVIQDN
jgi:Domain of unknown function DUF11